MDGDFHQDDRVVPQDGNPQTYLKAVYTLQTDKNTESCITQEKHPITKCGKYMKNLGSLIKNASWLMTGYKYTDIVYALNTRVTAYNYHMIEETIERNYTELAYALLGVLIGKTVEYSGGLLQGWRNHLTKP